MLKTTFKATRAVFSERGYRIAGVVTFAFFLGVYLLTLPASYTGARIGWVSLEYLTLRLAIFAVVLALLLALVLPMIMYVMREGQRARKVTTASSLLVSLVTPLVCCSPILPALMGMAAALLPFISATTSLRLQRFVVTYEIELYLGAILLLVAALFQNARAVLSCPRCRNTEEG